VLTWYDGMCHNVSNISKSARVVGVPKDCMKRCYSLGTLTLEYFEKNKEVAILDNSI